jgi:ABC-2 type transport system ATP-binding protein
MEYLVKAIELTKGFDGLLAVDGFSLSLGPGEIYGLMGPDGAGKTTAIRLLCGALEPDSGRVQIAGHDLAHHPEQAKAALGYLPQGFSMYGDLTVWENLRFYAETRGMDRQGWELRSREILKFVDLDEFRDRRADELSGGMRKKLGLAVALIHRPQILLLDEPTGGVDPVTRQAFWQLLIRLLKDGVAVLISTPYMDEASRCSRVGFMNRGRVLVEGGPKEIVRGLEGRVLEVIGEPRKLLRDITAGIPSVEDVHLFGDRLHVRVSSGSAEQVENDIRSMAADSDVSVTSVQASSPGLEDVFLELLQMETASDE